MPRWCMMNSVLTQLRSGARGAWSRIEGWATNSTPGLLTKGAAEFTGCMLFHFLGSAMPTPATNAIALTVLVYYTAKLSGAHLNPALTTTFALLGYTNPVEVVVYWIAQVSGSIIGALWLAVLVPGLGVGHGWSLAPPSATALSGCFVPSSSIGGIAVLGWEAICTFCFILPIFSVVWYTQSKSGYGNTGPLIVGLSLYSAASVAAPWTGAALNPARAIASRIVFGCAPNSLTGYYVAGEMIGAAIVPVAIAPWYGMSWSVIQSLQDRAYSYSVAKHPRAAVASGSDEESGGGSRENMDELYELPPPPRGTSPNRDESCKAIVVVESPSRPSPSVEYTPPSLSPGSHPDENAYRCSPMTSSSRACHVSTAEVTSVNSGQLYGRLEQHRGNRRSVEVTSPNSGQIHELRMPDQRQQQQQQQQQYTSRRSTDSQRIAGRYCVDPPENKYVCSPLFLPGVNRTDDFTPSTSQPRASLEFSRLAEAYRSTGGAPHTFSPSRMSVPRPPDTRLVATEISGDPLTPG